MKKATFICKSYEGWNKKSTILYYEYRGREYTINPQLYTSLAAQHRMAQDSIDADIEQEERQAEREKVRPYRYEDTAEYAVDLFWKYVNGEITDDKFFMEG